jgi:hypothetical protein
MNEFQVIACVVFVALCVLYVVIKEAITARRKRRRKTPGTKEWLKETLKPGAGLRADDD